MGDEFDIDSTDSPANCGHDSVNGRKCASCGSMLVETDDGWMIDVLHGTPWVTPTFTADGVCRCGAVLPNRCAWHNPYGTWSHIICASCGWEFVDEDDYLAIYDPEALARLGEDDEDHENCTILTPEQIARQVQWHVDHPTPEASR
jgi:hypothetical protein